MIFVVVVAVAVVAGVLVEVITGPVVDDVDVVVGGARVVGATVDVVVGAGDAVVGMPAQTAAVAKRALTVTVVPLLPLSVV